MTGPLPGPQVERHEVRGGRGDEDQRVRRRRARTGSGRDGFPREDRSAPARRGDRRRCSRRPRRRVRPPMTAGWRAAPWSRRDQTLLPVVGVQTVEHPLRRAEIDAAVADDRLGGDRSLGGEFPERSGPRRRSARERSAPRRFRAGPRGLAGERSATIRRPAWIRGRRRASSRECSATERRRPSETPSLVAK